uniref:Uncharacterized protein n=1 Tax=Rhizophora mucronata TaxID=61149 RepID=A0A2P2II91_RHIMU
MAAAKPFNTHNVDLQVIQLYTKHLID